MNDPKTGCLQGQIVRSGCHLKVGVDWGGGLVQEYWSVVKARDARGESPYWKDFGCRCSGRVSAEVLSRWRFSISWAVLVSSFTA